MKDIINLGKIPLDDMFKYKRSLQFLLAARNEGNLENIKKCESEHCKIVRNIESNMNLKDKIDDYKPEKWSFMIDKDFNFWMMTKKYVERNFINGEG